MSSAGKQFREAVKSAQPLQVVGVINAYFAVMAEKVGFQALYLSGAGVANASLGLPDLGMSELEDVLTDAQRIVRATSLPLLVDIDTGWDNITQTIQVFEAAGVAAVQIEDQIAAKRCGHRPNKVLVRTQEMVERVKEAVAARKQDDFVIMARTDAVAVEGMDAAIARAQAYVDAGADMIFAEALTDLSQYRTFKDQLSVPILANMTEFGKTQLFHKQDLYQAGADIVLYPLSTFRSASAAVLSVLESIHTRGDQNAILDLMQTRESLYDFLNYEKLEQDLDKTLKHERQG
tara:strand:+ start:21750 stop:22622 length:873 start_codon:yes stop_codon:yes gene_type:complete